MKVLFLTGMRSTKFGSLERWFLLLADELNKRDCSLVLHYNERPRSPEYLEALARVGCKVESSECSGGRLAEIKHYSRIIAQHQPDVVHCLFNSKTVYAAKLRRVKKVLWTLALEIPNYGFANRIAIKYLSNIRQCFSASEAILKQMIDKGFRKDRVSNLYFGLPFEYLEVKPGTDRETPDEIVFCVVAHYRRIKGVDVFLRAFAEILKEAPNCRFVQVGIDTAEHPEFLILAEELGVADKVKWVGISDDAYSHIANCDVYVQPSRKEALGFTVMEAMFAAIPIVATRVGGIPEAVVDGGNGWLVASEDHIEMANKCLSLIADPKLRNQMGAAGRKLVEEKFDSRELVAQLIDKFYVHECI